MKHRFQVLDIFRGIFASFVVFYHMREYTNEIVLRNQFVDNSFLFVDFFFILSGFVISYNYQSIILGFNDLRSFYIKRMRRIYPLHVVMLFVFLCYEILKIFARNNLKTDVNDSYNNIYDFFSSLVLLNSIKLPKIEGLSWNNPSWSISAEMISYLLFAIVTLLINKFKTVRVRIFVFISIILMSYYALVIYSPDGTIFRSFDFGFLRGFIGFFSGCICYNIFDSYNTKIRKLKFTYFSGAEIFVILLVVILVMNGDLVIKYGFVYEIIFILAVLIFAFEGGLISRVFKKSSILIQIGLYSYSIYMIHAIINRFVNIVFIRLLNLPESSYNYLFIINYIIVLLVAKWTYNNIELRFNRPWKKAFSVKESAL